MSQCIVKMVTYPGGVQPGGEKWYGGFWVYMLPVSGLDKYSNKTSVVETVENKFKANLEPKVMKALAPATLFEAAKTGRPAPKPAPEFAHAQLLSNPIALN
ncbi:MAG: hypothetical protein KGH63_03955 [Candidatus Micrarchaeota archaeon]|nr:hypothetical protein [Candidatus Micrarchaeota archaeon]